MFVPQLYMEFPKESFYAWLSLEHLFWNMTCFLTVQLRMWKRDRFPPKQYSTSQITRTRLKTNSGVVGGGRLS